MTAALEGGEWSAARPGHTLPPGKTWYPFYRRLGGSQDRSGQAENLVPTVIRSLIINTPVFSWHALMQLVEALSYKPEGCGFDSRWCHWDF